MAEIKPDINKTALVLSFVAGKKIGFIQENLNDSQPIVRIMPNTPTSVGLGAAGYSFGSSVTQEQRGFVASLLAAAGKAVEVDESLQDAITATSGSGPAYFFAFVDAMVDGAGALGLSREDANTLTNPTSTVTLDNVVLNTLGKDIKGAAWEAEWNGQKKSGKLDLAKGASSTLALAFDLPPSPGPRSVEGALTLNVVVDGLSLRWERAISAAQNIGLEKDLSLTALKPSKGAVNLRVDADATSLFLTFDLKKLDLEADAAGTALVAQVSLDARSYGQRLMSGNPEVI